MLKWIRIKGVAVFLIITAAICLFALLFVDTLTKKAIEATGTLIVGARVELANADLTFFPAGLALTGLQVTNPDEPMRNAVEAKRIALSVETMPILFRKWIVPEMSATGLRFDTERRYSGAIVKKEKKSEPLKAVKEAAKSLELPSLSMESAKEILAKETLTSVEEAKKFQEDIKTLKVRYKERIATLPTEEDLKAYEKRLKELKGGKTDWKTLLTKASDLKKITDDVERDLKNIKAVKADIETEIAGLKSRITAFPDLAKADYTRLKNTYGPTAMGLDNVTVLLFGDAYKGKVETAIGWYQKIQPMLEKRAAAKAKKEKEEAKEIKPTRGQGVDIAFAERHPLPDFLIKKGALELEIPAGTLSGTLENVTSQQPLVGRPMAFKFSGKGLKGLDSVALSATFNRVSPKTAGDHFAFAANGIAIKPMGSEKAVRMEGALANVTGKADIMHGTTLDASLKTQMSNVHFAIPADKGKLQQAIGRSLSAINAFTIEGSAKGPLSDYDLSVSSDLDTLLKKALKNATAELAAEFEKELLAAIQEKTGIAFSSADDALNSVTALSDDLAKRVQEGQRLL